MTEYAPQGALDRLIRRLDEEEDETIPFPHKQAMLQQVVSGCQALVAETLKHRDLATRNILVFGFDVADVSKTLVKVSDFGLAVNGFTAAHAYVQHEGAKSIRYLAPESLQKGNYSEKTDVWGFGVLAWELLTDGNKPYFMLPDDAAVVAHVLGGGRLPQPTATECPSTAVWEAVESCWLVPKKFRPTFAKLAIKLGRTHTAAEPKQSNQATRAAAANSSCSSSSISSSSSSSSRSSSCSSSSGSSGSSSIHSSIALAAAANAATATVAELAPSSTSTTVHFQPALPLQPNFNVHAMFAPTTVSAEPSLLGGDAWLDDDAYGGIGGGGITNPISIQSIVATKSEAKLPQPTFSSAQELGKDPLGWSGLDSTCSAAMGPKSSENMWQNALQQLVDKIYDESDDDDNGEQLAALRNAATAMVTTSSLTLSSSSSFSSSSTTSSVSSSSAASSPTLSSASAKVGVALQTYVSSPTPSIAPHFLQQQFYAGSKMRPMARCPNPNQPGCTLYVRAVPFDCTGRMLFDVFKGAGMIRHEKGFGTCINIHKMKTPPTKKGSPFTHYAYVEFNKRSGLQYCLASENRDSFYVTSLSAGRVKLYLEAGCSSTGGDEAMGAPLAPPAAAATKAPAKAIRSTSDAAWLPANILGSKSSSSWAGLAGTEVAKRASKPAPAPTVLETRVDPLDGCRYTQKEFTDLYGGLGEWRAAGGEKVVAKASAAASATFPTQRRDPADGKMYTRDDFLKCYGGLREWNVAGTESADWKCKCSFTNFKSRETCKNCGMNRPKKAGTVRMSAAASKAKVPATPKAKEKATTAGSRVPLGVRQQQQQSKKKKKKKKAKTETAKGVPVDVSCKDLKALLKEHGWESLLSKRKTSTQVYSLKKDGRTEKVSILWCDMESQGNRSKIRKYEEVLEKSGVLA